MANGTVMFISPTSGNVIQAGQGIPGTVIQPAGTVQYVQFVGQPVGSPNNQPQQNPQAGLMEKLRKVETKTLGAIQIMIGLIHIGFGVVSIFMFDLCYTSLAAFGGYPFWGGLFFIVSGSLSVSAEKHLTSNLVKCSVGMNITSAVMAAVGTCLYICELIINRSWIRCFEPVGTAIACLLLLFSLLEFCITVSTAHFGCQATCYSSDTIASRVNTALCVVLFLFTLLEVLITVSVSHFGCKATCCNNEIATAFEPYVIGNGMAPAENNPVPPAFADIVLSSNILSKEPKREVMEGTPPPPSAVSEVKCY
ncbi:membrane-spanning 4-domains subfamily A member 15-like [Rhineura floridana]|uniref:membrane-spanning 4-domains subfamily A member 15-like n=1 Tax=Rhineura floridana TaxID=261503 RepID=UPI002AC7F8FB|nr:membrane-spanning 4-domains subfamily A member 15-like [Rhineura floridana]